MEMRCIPVSNIQSLVAKLSGVAMMITSLYFYLAGTMALADCATMLVCSFMLFNALEAGGNYSALLRTIDLGVTKASKILALPTMDIEGKDNTVVSTGSTTGALIQASNVDFAYDKRKIIDNISLSIPEHSTTAIVGPSGGGKTTFCHLLARFWYCHPRRKRCPRLQHG